MLCLQKAETETEIGKAETRNYVIIPRDAQ